MGGIKRKECLFPCGYGEIACHLPPPGCEINQNGLVAIRSCTLRVFSNLRNALNGAVAVPSSAHEVPSSTRSQSSLFPACRPPATRSKTPTDSSPSSPLPSTRPCLRAGKMCTRLPSRRRGPSTPIHPRRRRIPRVYSRSAAPLSSPGRSCLWRG